MNEDGSLGFSHNAPQEGQTPTAKPVFSSGQEGVEKSSADASAANDTAISHDSPIEAPTVNNIAISHDSPIEAPTTTTIDTEPVDIFASPEERAAEAANTQKDTSNTVTSNNPDNHHIANSPFSSRNHFQSSANTTDPNIPQFFNDAIIANTPIEQPKKSKKGLIIGAIIGCLVLVGVAITATLMINKTPQSPDDKLANISAKELFYQYANKLLNDNTSSEPFEDSYDSKKEYAFMSKVVIDSDYNDTDSYDKAYLEELSTAYAKFQEKFLKDNEKIGNNYAKDQITDYSRLLEFFKEDPRDMLWSNKVIMDLYVTNGIDSAKAKTQELLNKKSNNNYISALYDIKKDSIQTSLKMITKYNANGCVKSGELISSCVSETTIDTKDGEPITHIARNLDKTAISLANKNYKQLATRCWDIKQTLEGK